MSRVPSHTPAASDPRTAGPIPRRRARRCEAPARTGAAAQAHPWEGESTPKPPTVTDQSLRKRGALLRSAEPRI